VGCEKWPRKVIEHPFQWAVHAGQEGPREGVDTNLQWWYGNVVNLLGGGENVPGGHWIVGDRRWWAGGEC
jgi:hypothetical protein